MQAVDEDRTGGAGHTLDRALVGGGHLGGLDGGNGNDTDLARQASGHERGGARARAGDPERIDIAHEAHEQCSGGRSDDVHHGFERLIGAHELLEVRTVAFANLGQQRVSGGHAGDIAHGAKQAEHHKPAKAQAPDLIHDGQQGDAHRGNEVRSHAHAAAVELVERSAAHKAADELRHRADDGKRTRRKRVTGTRKQHERQHDTGDAVAQQ